MHTEVRRVEPGSEGNTVLDLECGVGAEMVPQALAYPGQFLDQGNSKPLQIILGADSRQHEQLGGPDSARAQDNAVGLEG